MVNIYYLQGETTHVRQINLNNQDIKIKHCVLNKPKQKSGTYKVQYSENQLKSDIQYPFSWKETKEGKNVGPYEGSRIQL